MKTRGGIKGKLTRHENFLQSFSIENSSVEDFKERIEKMPEIWANFESVQDDIKVFDDTEA